MTSTTTEVIYGTRPQGAQAPDGSHIWATRTYADGEWTFTTYNGWLITGETTTSDASIASVIADHMAGWK